MAGELRDFGKVRPGELERVVVLSPHLDDAVLGAAHLMATYPRATSVFAPFGIANPDHAYVNDVALAVRARVGDDIGWFCYEDTGYKLVPGLLAWRISKLFLEALWPTPVAVATTRDEPRKERAMRCYASQIKSLGADWDLENAMLSPEQYWRLAPPPAGWEVIIDDIR